MKIHQNSTFKIQQINKLSKRALTVKTLNKTKFSEKQFFKTSEDITSTQEILYQYDSTHQFLHQHINNSKQQSNAENQMK
jgi:hypothetical protein